MSARGPGREKRTAGQSTAGRRGEVSMQMTADGLMNLAVNVVQNRWSYDDLSGNVLADAFSKNPEATRPLLEKMFAAILEANRLAAQRRTGKRQD